MTTTYRTNLSPSLFRVINTRTGDDHGTYETIDEARGCVEFDRLTSYEIWHGDRIVEEEGSPVDPKRGAKGGCGAGWGCECEQCETARAAEG